MTADQRFLYGFFIDPVLVQRDINPLVAGATIIPLFFRSPFRSLNGSNLHLRCKVKPP
jgi:hypothetical protein